MTPSSSITHRTPARARAALTNAGPAHRVVLPVDEVPDARETRRAQVDDNTGADTGLP